MMVRVDLRRWSLREGWWGERSVSQASKTLRLFRVSLSPGSGEHAELTVTAVELVCVVATSCLRKLVKTGVSSGQNLSSSCSRLLGRVRLSVRHAALCVAAML